MKKIVSLFTVALLCMTGIYAQETNVKDKKEETVTTKLIVNNGKTVETVTVKEETTTQKQKVKLSDKDNHYENQNIEYVPEEAKKTVRINDMPDAKKTAKKTFYTYNNKKYVFIPDHTGFSISYDDGKRQTQKIKLRKTNANGHYLATGKGFSGIGYFDENRNFIIEYPAKSSNTVMIQKYVPQQ